MERIRSRGAVHRKFAGFLVDGELPADANTKIQAEGKDVGEITSVASLPLEGNSQRPALGYIRREVLQSGKLLEAGGIKLNVADIPFSEVFHN